MSRWGVRQRLGNIVESALDSRGYRRAPGLPSQVHLSVTDRCFLPCLHCDIWKNEDVDLPTEFWLDAIDQLGEWCAPAGMNFVGGEPLLRKDLETLIQRAHRWGFETSMNTNAWLLNPERVRRLKNAQIGLVYVSLDGFTAETVDHSRGREGSFTKAMEAIDMLRNEGVTVWVASVFHKGNAQEIVSLAQWVHLQGVRIVMQPLYQNFGNVQYQPDWWETSDFFPRSPDELRDVSTALDRLTEMSQNGIGVVNSPQQLQAMKWYFANPGRDSGVSCRAGHSDISIDPKGQIRLCYFLEPVGTFQSGISLQHVWNDVETLRRRWTVSRCERSCSLLNCNFDTGV